MNFPEDLKYTKDHEWVRVTGDTAVVGITEYAQNELGDLVYTDLPPMNRVVKQGEAFCVVESTKAASDVYAPISGKVIEQNSELGSNPELINKDPYQQGWIARLSDINPAELENLMTAEQYRKHVGK